MSAGKLETHEHCIISGPRAHRSGRNKVTHSHEGGDLAHTHADTGPSVFTIDRDAWLAATGLVGGGKKKCTKAPFGEQLGQSFPYDGSFRVIVCDPPCPPGHVGEGPGDALPMRIAGKFRIPFTVERARKSTNG